MYETKLRRDFPRDINNVPLHAFCRLLRYVRTHQRAAGSGS